MSGFKHFAVAGAGGIGRFIVEELLKFKDDGRISSVVILTRGVAKLAASDAKIVTVDYTSGASLTSALSGIDVVVSAVGASGLASQVALADAAREAGVKLFVPAEYGVSTKGITEGVFGLKNKVQGHLEKIGLPYSLFFTGPFSDFIFIPRFGWDLPNGKVTVSGEGNAPVSWTSRPDIARFVAYVLVNLPLEKLEWKAFAIEGDRKSLNEILEGYQAKTGKTLDITRLPRSSLEEAVQQDSNNYAAWIQLIWDTGKSVVGKRDELANGLWPDWNPTSVVDILAQ